MDKEIVIKTNLQELNVALGAIEQIASPYINVVKNWRDQAIEQLQQPVVEEKAQ